MSSIPIASYQRNTCFIGMLGLVLGGIPIEGIEHARFGIVLMIYGKQVMDPARNWLPHHGHAPQSALEMIEKRYSHLQNGVQRLRLHLAGIATPKIAEAIPFVISTVEPEAKTPPGLRYLLRAFTAASQSGV